MVSSELEELSVSLRMQDLDLYCRSDGDQKDSFHLRVVHAAQKTSSNI
jgi:hypothetical protein